jgi:hypothetical protein
VCVYYRENTHTHYVVGVLQLCVVCVAQQQQRVLVLARAHDTVAFFLIDAFRLVHWGAHARATSAHTHTHTHNTQTLLLIII